MEGQCAERCFVPDLKVPGRLKPPLKSVILSPCMCAEVFCDCSTVYMRTCIWCINYLYYPSVYLYICLHLFCEFPLPPHPVYSIRVFVRLISDPFFSSLSLFQTGIRTSDCSIYAKLAYLMSSIVNLRVSVLKRCLGKAKMWDIVLGTKKKSLIKLKNSGYLPALPGNTVKFYSLLNMVRWISKVPPKGTLPLPRSDLTFMLVVKRPFHTYWHQTF